MLMKRLFVLLITTAVVLGASAGVNRKLINKQTTKVNIKEMKAMDHHTKMVKKGDANVLPGTPLKAFDPTKRTKINHAQRYSNTWLWDFEDEEQMNDWTVRDDDEDGYSWEYLYDADGIGFQTHSGIGCVSSASYDNNYGALYPDNWLISPLIELGGTFGFYACGQDPSYACEYFIAYVNVDGEWIELGEAETTGSMKAYAYDLSYYEGMEGCVAIRHCNVSDMFRLNVDDITIGEFETEPEPETPTVITEIPDGCQTNIYLRNSACIYSSYYGISSSITNNKFTVAFAPDGEVYIQNPAWYLDSYGSWVKGTYDQTTGIITIPTGQYLSWNKDYGYGIMLGWGSTYVYTLGDDEYYMGYEIDENITEIQMMVHDNYIYLLNTQGDINAEFPDIFNATGLYAYYSDDLSLTALEFCNHDENGNEKPFGILATTPKPVIPASPTADEWYDCGDESGYSKFCFTLPTTDVDGNSLDPEHLSYAVWINDGFGNMYQYTFRAADYTLDLYNDINEVPYEIYSSAVDFHDNYVYMYRTNENDNPLFVQDATHNGNIGIQAFYTISDMKNASEIIWLFMSSHNEVDPPSASIESGTTVLPGTEVYLSHDDPEIDIYYALEYPPFSEGGIDVLEWHLYGGQPIVIEKDMKIWAYAFESGHSSDVVSFVYYTSTWLRGDLNGDGEVNIADVNAVISIILGEPCDDATLASADVNGDEEINIADINAIINIILNN